MVHSNVSIVVSTLDEIMNKQHILFISYDGMTDPLGQSQVIPYLQGLSGQGYSITILSCEKPAVYNAGKKNIQTILNKSQIKWHPILYTKRPPVLSTLYDIYKLKRVASGIYRQKAFQMVHTRPGIPSLVGHWLKKKYGVYFLNDIREFYADSRVDGGMWKQSSFIYRIIYRYFKKQEMLQVKASDGIVCLTYAAEKIIKQWPYYNPAVPIKVIPCSADLQLFDPGNINQAQKKEYAERLGIKPKDFIVSYLGSIGGWYLTDEMLRFCKLLSLKNPSAKFLFITPHRHEQVVAAAMSHNLPTEKIITVTASRKEVPTLLSFSDFAVFFIKPCYSKLSSSPTKHGELMAMGIPVITNGGVGDMYEFVTNNKAGFIVDDFTDDAFRKVVEAIHTVSPFSKDQIRLAAQNIYALTSAVESYAEMYALVLND